MAREESRLRERRGHERLRAEGGGPSRQLVLTDRVIATLVILRFQLPHAALAVFYSVDRSTVTRAVHEIRPLLAARGFAVPGEAGLRLHTLADVFAYATAKGVATPGRHRGTGPASEGGPPRPEPGRSSWTPEPPPYEPSPYKPPTASAPPPEGGSGGDPFPEETCWDVTNDCV
ncbi:transposase family protein [Streptomyces sp. NPDC001312]|uniref:helix-turn-helix domain-containing protein n=1 Tax=Streptomyces sp. NPDC001312 TaxID=3364561 RepID=UPI003695FB3B